MCHKMEFKVLVWMYFLIASVKATKVNLTSEWKPNSGWVITCSWSLINGDSLQSVRMSEDDRQFLVYRPEINGNERYHAQRRAEDTMIFHCLESIPRGLVGTCVITLELHMPRTTNSTYSCEVSGERPRFLVDKQTLVVGAFVSASDAVIEETSRNEESGRVMLNCSSSGSPAPRLVWTIGGQTVPPDFNSSIWNTTSKLWHVWSAVSYTHSNEHTAVCTPEIDWAGETTRGVAASYNAADIVRGFQGGSLTLHEIVFVLWTVILYGLVCESPW